MRFFPETPIGYRAWLAQSIVGPALWVGFVAYVSLPNRATDFTAIGAMGFMLLPTLALMPFPLSAGFLAAADLQSRFAHDSLAIQASVYIACYVASGPWFGRLVEIARSGSESRGRRIGSALCLLGNILGCSWLVEWLRVSVLGW